MGVGAHVGMLEETSGTHAPEQLSAPPAHFLLETHAAQCAELIKAFVDRRESEPL